jgi:hypothetical protein
MYNDIINLTLNKKKIECLSIRGIMVFLFFWNSKIIVYPLKIKLT